jgi:phenylacetate-CoA ligase
MKRALSRKNLWDHLPRPVRLAVGLPLALIPLGYLLGRRFREQCHFVRMAQWWPVERCREYQLHGLRRILALAYDKTVYYRRAFSVAGFEPGDLKSIEDMARLPTMDKNSVRENLEELCARPVDHPSVDHCSTGGSGGVPLFFYMGSERSAIEYAYLIASFGRAGYRPRMPMAVLRGRIVRPDGRGLYHEYDPILRHHYYSNFHMTDENMGRYLAHIATIGPCFLHVYPSSVAALARFIRRAGVKAPGNIRGIIAESENVYADQRKMTEEVFGARMFSLYGHSEKLVLAAECEHSSDYHVWPMYGFCELLDEAGHAVTTRGQRGEIVGTGFINTVVPFIRYRTGDYATYLGDRCEACGRQHVIIRDVEGRWPSGALVTLSGTLISMTALNVHDDTFVHAKQFQFYQDTPGRAVLRVVPAEKFGEEDQRRIQHNLGRKLDGQVTFAIELVDSIPLSPRGKAIYVDQRITVAQQSGQEK